MGWNTTQILIMAAGGVFGLGLAGSGVQELRQEAPAPYLVAQPLAYDRAANLITQRHRVVGVQNMPATWEARISAAPGGPVLCAGQSSRNGGSYLDGETSTFSPSQWTGGDCPPGPLPIGAELFGRWTYDVGGQEHASSVRMIVK